MKIFSSMHPGPAKVKNQRRTLESWRAAGFDPVLVNPASDQARWRESYADLAGFHPVSEGRAFRGRWVPIREILMRALTDPGPDPILILNSDIVLMAGTGLKAGVRRNRDSVVMIRRTEVPSLDGGPFPATGDPNPWGWDGCSIPRGQAGLFRDRSFCLGLPCWDYWIPYKAIHHGLAVVLLEGRHALHETHPEEWSEREQARLTRRIARDTGIPPWRRWWLRHFGPRDNRKIYGHYNHFSGHIRDTVRRRAHTETLTGSG